MKASVTTRLNLEMSVANEIVNVALTIKPAQVTLVPERREELTTEGGLDVAKLQVGLVPLIRNFSQAGIAVSLFIDPAIQQVRAARETGATTIELHTGRYAAATTPGAKSRELAALAEAARAGGDLGLAVAAGHGLDYGNVGAVAELSDVEEVNIGFSIIVRALSIGLEQAVREMVGLLKKGRQGHVLQAA